MRVCAKIITCIASHGHVSHCLRSITRQLVSSGFQFEQLLTMYKTRGLNVLELQVREEQRVSLDINNYFVR